MNYTDEQNQVLKETGNCVIIAAPGSGKTATVAALIQTRLETLPTHKGVIAISYTNKASQELRQRVRQGGVEVKASFFGTVDRFFITAVVAPFGRRIWGRPIGDLTVSKFAEIEVPHSLTFRPDLEDADALRAYQDELGELYKQGIIVLEAVGYLACYILSNSLACRKYICARYSDIVIDEYQDCGRWQHEFFLLLTEAGLRGIAVGDLDQSIFSFADKYPRFLRELAEDNRFSAYRLTVNHRCHPAIAHYAAKFLSVEHVVPPGQERRVFHAHLNGSERDIGEWLNHAVPAAMKRFGVDDPNKIGILVRNNRTAELVKGVLQIPCRHAVSTILDEDNTPASIVFKNLLNWVFSRTETRRGFVDEYVDPNAPKMMQRKLVHLLSELQVAVPFDEYNIDRVLELMILIAEIVTGRKVPSRAASRLSDMLKSGAWAYFIPPFSEEIQLMTIFKAKGLEFDIVFHLDLYEHVLPKYKRESEPEEANLHYVALTRAKSACILCSSTVRHNSYKALRGSVSPFLHREGLNELRDEW
ncbi:MAG TPA: ATP-dependent helicase [Longimicrobiaceae bacterium]|nr:ATP-dependent helicase [Longimicrobiaceae bacterium]